MAPSVSSQTLTHWGGGGGGENPSGCIEDLGIKIRMKVLHHI